MLIAPPEREPLMNDLVVPLLLILTCLLLVSVTVGILAYWYGRTHQIRHEPDPIFVVEAPEMDERLAMIQEQATQIMALQSDLALAMMASAEKDATIADLRLVVAKKEALRARYLRRVKQQQSAAREVWSQIVTQIARQMPEPVLT